jgi:D-arabinose 1-dehydrogenase-like Zn-dependent alcohol dehydrogenase
VIGIGGLGHLAVQYANKLGMKVTAFTTKPERTKELAALGATATSHSVNKESLKAQEGNFDIVINTLFIDDREVYQAHQRLTAPGGVYIGVGVPSADAKFPLDHDYLSKNQVKVAGSSVGKHAR